MRSFMLLTFAVIVAGLAGSRAADAGWRTRGWGYGPVLNGQANLIRAQGQYQLSSAQASLAFEQAQALAIQNHKQAVETRWQLQDEWARRQTEKLSSHRAGTEAIARAASDAAPKRLSG